MINILNNKRLSPNIYHFQGKSQIMNACIVEQNNKLKDKKLTDFPNDLSIITTFTDKEKSFLIHQLEESNIQYYNSYKEEYGEFYMPNKVEYILNALKEIKTKYCLILDGYDVLINSFSQIMERYFEYNTKILFNASKNNYPVCTIDKMPERDYIGSFNHFNAGCAIGITNDLIDFYQKCLDLMRDPNFFNPYDSEQFVLRHIFAEYSEDKEKKYINIDYNCNVFLALSQSLLINDDGETTMDYIAI